MPAEHVESFGSSAALGRPGQPAEVAPAYVMLASDEASIGARHLLRLEEHSGS